MFRRKDKAKPVRSQEHILLRFDRSSMIPLIQKDPDKVKKTDSDVCALASYTDEEGKTALMLCLEYKRYPMFWRLLSFFREEEHFLNHKNDKGKALIHYLLDIDAPEDDLISAVSRAIACSAISKLVGSIDLSSKEEQYPYQIAYQKGMKRLATMLLPSELLFKYIKRLTKNKYNPLICSCLVSSNTDSMEDMKILQTRENVFICMYRHTSSGETVDDFVLFESEKTNRRKTGLGRLRRESSPI